MAGTVFEPFICEMAIREISLKFRLWDVSNYPAFAWKVTRDLVNGSPSELQAYQDFEAVNRATITAVRAYLTNEGRSRTIHAKSVRRMLHCPCHHCEEKVNPAAYQRRKQELAVLHGRMVYAIVPPRRVVAPQGQ